MNIVNRIRNRISRKIGNFLRNRYAYFNVTKPYIVKIDDKSELRNKIAVITGGSGAIGRACAFRLAIEGAKVYVCGSKPDSANKVVQEINNAGYNAIAVQLNVLDAQTIENTFRQIALENSNRIDILINSAGGSARDFNNNFTDQNVDIIDNLLNINLRGTMLCSKEASKYMRNNNYGRIVNITSVIGLIGKVNFCEYAASKGGSIAFLKSLAQELGMYNITVNGVAPGIVQRGIITKEIESRLKKTNWMNSICTPEDIAAVVNFLCKNEASFITGQNICVDGGRSLSLKES